MAESITAKPLEETQPRTRSRARRMLGTFGRSVRVLAIVALVVIVASLVYLGEVGLPPAMQEKVTARLRARGWDVQFSKMHVSYSRLGLVAENVYLRRANGPQIYVRRAQCRLRRAGLRRLRVEIATVKLSGARVIWSLENTNHAATTFLLHNASGELHFRENDIWDLQSFSATVMGARLNFSGTLTNGSMLRDWRVPQLRRKLPEENLARWRSILNTAQQIQFEGTPELVTRFAGDAANLPSSRGNLVMHVPAVTSPWGSGTNLLISAHLNDDLDAGDPPVELDILFEEGRTPWARAKAFRFKTGLDLDFAHLISPTNLQAIIEAEIAEGPWGAAHKLSGQVSLTGNVIDSPGLQTTFNLHIGPWRHEHFEAATAEIRATASHARTNWFVALLRDLAATNRPWSERLAQLPMEADFALSGAKAGAVDAEELLVRTRWQWPVASLGVEGKVEDGGIRLAGSFNTTNRAAQFDGSSTVDPHRVSPLLTQRTRNWLTNYQWQAAPKVQAQGRLTLPVITNKIDWARDVLPALFVEGGFDLGPCRYRGVPLDAAKSPFWFSNSIFCLPALEVRNGEGSARGQYTSVPATRNFHWRLNSQLDPKILRPLFPTPAQQRGFGMVEFSVPPRLGAEVWGRWQDPASLAVVAQIEGTNFAIRGQKVQSARSRLVFTNLQLHLIEPEVTRPNERGTATHVTIDVQDQRIYFTNVQGNLDPHTVARAIGPSSFKAVAPYIFSTPPDIQLNGMLDIKSGRRQDDMHFLISGGPFYWEPFHIHRIGGKLHWAGYNLFLNEVIAQLYSGQGKGDAKFEIGTNDNTQFQFRAEWSDVDLSQLMRDLSPRTNNLEGTIRGDLQIVTANTRKPKSWNGRGIVELKDGLIWDFPMFGAFSPILNAFIPGLGNSRARDGASSFIITNSVIHTTDLEINATAMRMQFNGTIDFQRNIDGRMEAQLLRNVPAIGLLLSKILWPVTKIFEYKVAGTLQEPETEPVYVIPKLIYLPFSPIRTIKDLFGIGRPDQPREGVAPPAPSQ